MMEIKMLGEARTSISRSEAVTSARIANLVNGFYPRCRWCLQRHGERGARRMAETAALLSDDVFPDVPLRLRMAKY
jgi:hypothetical protein